MAPVVKSDISDQLCVLSLKPVLSSGKNPKDLFEITLPSLKSGSVARVAHPWPCQESLGLSLRHCSGLIGSPFHPVLVHFRPPQNVKAFFHFFSS